MGPRKGLVPGLMICEFTVHPFDDREPCWGTRPLPKINLEFMIQACV